MCRLQGGKPQANIVRILFCFYIFVSVPVAFAEDGDQAAVVENLRKVREQIEREERRLADLQKKQEGFEAAAEKLTNEAAAASEKKKTLSAAVDQLRDEADRVSRAVSAVKDNIENRRDGLRQRIVAIYKTQRRSAALDYLFSASSSTELLKRTRYLTAVAGYDKNYLQGLGKLISSLQKDQQRLDVIQRQKTDNLQQVDVLEAELSKKREEKAMLLAEARDKVQQEEKSLDKLRVSADKFEHVLASIMGGDRYQLPPEEGGGTEHQGIITNGTTSGGGLIIVAPFDGRGLEGLRGKLVFPVKGALIQRFGKQKHDEFADILFVKGLEVHAAVGSRVQAVAAGKIVLSQVLPGYGNVIIVDHGERYYTLYGRLAGTLKAVGDVVKSGDDIAVLGEADYKGRNFYFELRIKGKATNPLEYFRESPPTAKT